MAFQNQTDLDVVYDGVAYGSVIDPTQWNANFKKIEDTMNANIDKIDANFDALEAITDGSSGADVIGATPVGGGTANTVQGVLEEIQALDAANVHLTGDETVAGVKTFSSSPVIPTPTTDMQVATKKYVDDQDATNVHLTGNESIGGVKTFTSSPIAPTPTTGDNTTKVATTAFVGATMVAVGAGDMSKAVYDTSNKATDVFGYVDVRLPAGIITMWSGAVDAVPSGWLLCDGNNGTPNLLDRFIVGAGSTYAVGTTGGATSTSVGTHTHGVAGTSAAGGAHTHTYSGTTGDPSGTRGVDGTNLVDVASSSHDHSYSGTTSNSGSHTHTMDFTSAAGGNHSVTTLPPYYALCYIMKA